MLKWEHFSSWSKLIYHVAALLKIKNNWLLWTKYRYTTKSYLTSLKLSQKVKNCSANVKKNVIWKKFSWLCLLFLAVQLFFINLRLELTSIHWLLLLNLTLYEALGLVPYFGSVMLKIIFPAWLDYFLKIWKPILWRKIILKTWSFEKSGPVTTLSKTPHLQNY